MTEADLHWTIGMLEGEGCFTPQSRLMASSVRLYYPLVQVTSIDMDILVRLQGLWGGRIYPLKQKKPTHSLSWQWRAYGPVAVKVIEAAYPYMGLRRTAQIEAAVAKIEANPGFRI